MERREKGIIKKTPGKKPQEKNPSNNSKTICNINNKKQFPPPVISILTGKKKDGGEEKGGKQKEKQERKRCIFYPSIPYLLVQLFDCQKKKILFPFVPVLEKWKQEKKKEKEEKLHVVFLGSFLLFLILSSLRQLVLPFSFSLYLSHPLPVLFSSSILDPKFGAAVWDRTKQDGMLCYD